MELTDAIEQLTALQRLLPAIQEALKEAAVKEAVANGARVIIRPEWFRHPLKGQSDPFFGLAYQDWLKLRNEGFSGWMEMTEGSERAKLMINYEAARAYLETRMQGQQQRRDGPAGSKKMPECQRSPKVHHLRSLQSAPPFWDKTSS